MSLKSLIQIIILIIIFIILGGVYFKYFSNEKILVDEIKDKSAEEIENFDQKKQVDSKINGNQLSKKENKKLDKNNIKKFETHKSNKKEKVEIPNLVKDVEYLTSDTNGNKYKILASSGKTNKTNTNILDLIDVKGEITSDKRSNIYIVSDFAKYNSSTSGSKFYSNVIINYEDKQINCENFDINMDTNLAIAYNNVVVIDPKSIMKAGKITLNIETKEIFINPDANKKGKVKINTKK
tara:strand:+ start:135 stop:848 length:714 start_codon:yes stop_codon:yes gene_type:complete